jgi:hypothetical protein
MLLRSIVAFMTLVAFGLSMLGSANAAPKHQIGLAPAAVDLVFNVQAVSSLGSARSIGVPK